MHRPPEKDWWDEEENENDGSGDIATGDGATTPMVKVLVVIGCLIYAMGIGWEIWKNWSYIRW